jgi:hypothetical protein
MIVKRRPGVRVLDTHRLVVRDSEDQVLCIKDFTPQFTARGMFGAETTRMLQWHMMDPDVKTIEIQKL